MNAAEYRATQDALVTIALVVADLDLDGFLADISRAEALGPILDPTLYRAGSDKLRQVRDLAEAFQGAQGVVRRQRAAETGSDGSGVASPPGQARLGLSARRAEGGVG